MKVAVVTGANTGIGLECARHLARRGYHVVLACRNQQKAKKAINDILKDNKKAQLEYIHLDLTDKNSIEKFSKELYFKYSKVNILINNAGVMLVEQSYTTLGNEYHLEANFLGHFYLTYLLENLLNSATEAKVISMSSIAHKSDKAHLNFEDINMIKHYDKYEAYCQSKLACALFGIEFDRRLRKANSSIKSIVVHPGVCLTDMVRNFPPYAKKFAPFVRPIVGIGKPIEGAEHVLFAALNPQVNSGDFIGPISKREWKGNPGRVNFSSQAKDEKLAKQLWEHAEQVYDIDFEVN